MAYGDFKDLARRTAPDKNLGNKTFNVAENPKYDGYQRGLASIVYKIFEKKTSGRGFKSMPQNEKLAEERHKQILESLKKEEYIHHSETIIADLADVQSISKLNKRLRFLLFVIDIFSKNACVIPLKDKKGVTIVNAFQKILSNSMELHAVRKPNKIFVGKASEFYNNSFIKWLQDNDIEMYSTHNEGKSVVSEKFIRTLRNKIYKYMTSTSNDVYIDKLDDIVNKYKNAYRRTIKIKPIVVKDSTYINIDQEVNNKNLKIKIGNHLRISKYKTIFAKGYSSNWSGEVFVITEINYTVMLLMI